jgi:DNA-binding NarL/FixJ family response regulator
MGIRLAFAEDNLLVREGISHMLATIDDIDVVAICGDADDARAAVDEHRPDVVLTDIRMPPTHTDDGIRLADEWRDSHPDLGVVVLSQFVEPAFALAVLARGTARRGYLLKEHVDDVDLLVQAIQTVAAGGSFLDDAVVAALMQNRRGRHRSALGALTTREAEVLSELATGQANVAIARTLDISTHAVEKHTSSIFLKLDLPEDPDVNRRVAAVLLYLAQRVDGCATG